MRPNERGSQATAGFAVERLRSGDVEVIGPAVRESWEAKRKLASGVSNGHIDLTVTRALDAGPSGAKLTGASGGGFLLVICPMEQQCAVCRSFGGHAGIAGKAGSPRLARRVQRDARHLGLMQDLYDCRVHFEIECRVRNRKRC